MYTDNTLTPKEAVRLCALGTLAQAPVNYGTLANAIRHFVGHVIGPSLDVMGPSLELLKYEGLIEAVDGIGMEDDAMLAITDDGREELRNLLSANIRSSAAELNKLIFALKFHFLHLLDRKGQRRQAGHMVEVCENELARLEDLRQYHAGSEGYLLQWLDHDIALLESRLDWLREFHDKFHEIR